MTGGCVRSMSRLERRRCSIYVKIWSSVWRKNDLPSHEMWHMCLLIFVNALQYGSTVHHTTYYIMIYPGYGILLRNHTHITVAESFHQTCCSIFYTHIDTIYNHVVLRGKRDTHNVTCLAVKSRHIQRLT